MNKKKKYINKSIIFGLCSAAVIYSSLGVAKDFDDYPNGCTPHGYSFKFNVLNLYPKQHGNVHSLYFIHNDSMHSSVKLFQMRNGDEPYIIYLNNQIKPNQWGVLATDEPELRYICTKPDSSTQYGEIIDCADVLSLCEFTNVKFSINNYGNYWAVSSKSKWGAIRQAIYQGILLRW